MLTLTDSQIAILTTVAERVPIENEVYCWSGRFARGDDDFRDALTLASVGLCQSDGFVVPTMTAAPK